MIGLRTASSPTRVIGFRFWLWASASLTAATTSLGPKSPPIASTAIRPGNPGAMTVGVTAFFGWSGLDLYVENLATAVGTGLGIHAMGPYEAAICGITGELRRYESVGCTAVCATTLGLLAFWIGH